MAAVQPFISGAISKTVNLPEEATVEEVEQLHIDAWKLGVKAIAIYRDNCKVAQPLSTAKKESGRRAAGRGASTAAGAEPRGRGEDRREDRGEGHQGAHPGEAPAAAAPRAPSTSGWPTARASSPSASSRTAGPGEIFLRISKQGSTLAGIMDAFAISVSYGLQYGVPLRVYVETLTNTRFEPAGMTDDPDLRIASSILDYIFRRLAVDYLSLEERTELNILTTGERTQPTLPGRRGDGHRDPPGHRAAGRPAQPRRQQPAALGRPTRPRSSASSSGPASPARAWPRPSRTRTSRPRPPTATPPTACSAASRCSGPAPATPAPAAAAPAAAAE